MVSKLRGETKLKKQLALIAVLLTLGGCATDNVQPAPRVVVETHYVVRLPPKELTTLPPKVPNIDVDKADQAQVSGWLLQKEQYTRTLENMLVGIGKFFVDQQAAADAQAAAETAKSKADAEKQQQQDAIDASKRKVDLNQFLGKPPHQ